jgi:hypothetical protein
MSTSSNRITIKGSCQQGCSVKRGGVGGSGEQNGSEMIDCPAAMPNRATSTHGPPQKGHPERGYSPAPSGFGGSPPLRSEGCGSDPLNIHSNPGPGPFPDPRQSFFVPLWFLRSSLPSSRPSPLSHRRSERPTVSVRAPSTHFIPHGILPFLTSSDVPPVAAAAVLSPAGTHLKRGPLLV